MRKPFSLPTLLAFAALLLLVSACGGGEQAQQPPPPPPPDKAAGGAPPPPPGGGAPAKNAPGGSTVESPSGGETLEDQPLELNLDQPLPQDFRAAYQRRAFIVVEFFKEDPDTQRDPVYPVGLEVDDFVTEDLRDLQRDYSQVEFFYYDIDDPGDAESSEELERGQYGTLAIQLEVGFTPFVAMLAPGDEGYIVANLYQGYVDRGVLDQALFDLTSRDVGGNANTERSP